MKPLDYETTNHQELLRALKKPAEQVSNEVKIAFGLGLPSKDVTSTQLETLTAETASVVINCIAYSKRLKLQKLYEEAMPQTNNPYNVSSDIKQLAIPTFFEELRCEIEKILPLFWGLVLKQYESEIPLSQTTLAFIVGVMRLQQFQDIFAQSIMKVLFEDAAHSKL